MLLKQKLLKRLNSFKNKTKRLGLNAVKKALKVDPNDDEEDQNGFKFENNINIGIKLTLENYNNWKEKGIKFPKEFDNLAVVDLTSHGNNDDFRTLSQFQSINKFVMKSENKYYHLKNMSDKLIKIDIFIDGMKPIYGVPIEVSGLRSYELTRIGETEKESKNKKHQFAFILDIHQDGTNKVVSFESQVIFTNNTEFDINIGHVFSKGTQHLKDELSEEEIKEYYRVAYQNRIANTNEIRLNSRLIEILNNHKEWDVDALN